jgi:hypothetical protein
MAPPIPSEPESDDDSPTHDLLEGVYPNEEPEHPQTLEQIRITSEIRFRLENSDVHDTRNEFNKFMTKYNRYERKAEKSKEWLRSATIGAKSHVVEFLC